MAACAVVRLEADISTGWLRCQTLGMRRGRITQNMATETVKPLSAEEITELCLRHTLYDWSAQAGIKPMPIASAKGVRFQTVDGRRFIDFNSQLMCVNAGHGDRRIIDAIKAQAERLPSISP